MIQKFTTFLLTEAEGPAHGGIQHIEHPADRTFDHREAAENAISSIKGAVEGSSPITKKIDDKMSFQAIRRDDGAVGVKYKGPGSHYNFSADDVDKQHGHKPYLAAPLKLLHEHLHKVLPKEPGEYQGGYMSAPHERQINGGVVSHKPNTIEYRTSADGEEGKKLRHSKVSVVIHSKLEGPNREASPITDMSAFKKHPDVHQINHVVTDDEQRSVDPNTQRRVKLHLHQASKLMKKHSFDHVSGHEIPLRTYINHTIRTGEEPTTEGYIRHKLAAHNKKIEGVKTDKAKQAKTDERDADVKHIEGNKEHFDRGFKLHHHVQLATNLLATGLAKVAHGGYSHHIDGEEAEPEGFVVKKHGQINKIVNRQGFSAANFKRSQMLRAGRTSSSTAE